MLFTAPVLSIDSDQDEFSNSAHNLFPLALSLSFGLIVSSFLLLAISITLSTSPLSLLRYLVSIFFLFLRHLKRSLSPL